MAANSEQERTVLRLWLLFRRVGDSLGLAQDLVCGKYGLTSQQFAVLVCIKSRGPLKQADLARMLQRSRNSMTFILDRMIKAGLVRRKRNRKDRRAVSVTMTDKGNDAIEMAAPAGWEFIHEVVSPLSYQDQRALADMLETVNCVLIGRVNPETDMADIIKKSLTADPDLYKRMVKNVLPPAYQPKCKVAETKTIR